MPFSLSDSLSRRAILALVFLCFTPAGFSQTTSLQEKDQPTETQLQAKQALDRGIEEFKNGQYEEAARLFTKAKELDPSLLNARLYLATAYAAQYIPGAPSGENVRFGKLASVGYRDVLRSDPTNLSAIDGLASILYQRAGQPFDPTLFEEAKACHQKHIKLKPEDPEPYYSTGVIDWALAFRANTKLRQEFNQSVGGEGLKAYDPLPEVLRTQYVREFESIVDEGIAALNHAIELKPDYDDAMTYLNLLYRRKADMAATQTERDQFTDMADELLDKVKDLKQKQAEAKN